MKASENTGNFKQTNTNEYFEFCMYVSALLTVIHLPRYYNNLFDCDAWDATISCNLTRSLSIFTRNQRTGSLRMIDASTKKYGLLTPVMLRKGFESIRNLLKY